MRVKKKVTQKGHGEIKRDRRRKRESKDAHKGFGVWVWACAVVGCGLERGETLGKE